MAFKFPGAADVARGAIGDIIQGRSIGDAAIGASIKGTGMIMQAGSQMAQTQIDRAIQKIEQATGLGLGRTSIGEILNDPIGALSSVIGSGNLGGNVKAGWYPLLEARPDPLFEIDWVPMFPLDLPPEYVEEIQWSHARFNASTGVFRYGSYIYMIESMEHTPITVTLYEDRMMTATNWLYAWRAHQFDEASKTFGYQGQYKMPIRALIRDVAGATVGQIAFLGCFPTTFPQVNMASEGSNRVRLQVEFSCDKIVFEGYGGAGSTSADQTWQQIIQNGVGSIAEGAFGRFSTTIKPITSAIDGAISGAKRTASSIMGSIAGSIRF